MDASIRTYALVKTLFDENKDFVDCFWPIVIREFPNDFRVSVSTVASKLKASLDIDIPQHVIESFLTRAKRKGFVEQHQSGYGLTRKGREYVFNLESCQQADNRIKLLVEDLARFAADAGVETNEEEIETILKVFLARNSKPLIEFLNPDSREEVEGNGRIRILCKVFIDYIESISLAPNAFQQTLEDMIFGSTIAALLNVQDADDIESIANKEFSKCLVFLDTNFVFCALGMDLPIKNKPVLELTNMLRKNNFSLRIYGFTVDEICRVVSSYPYEANKYPLSVGINSIYRSLKSKGWKKSDVIEFITNVEDILRRHGIVIEGTPEVDVRNYPVSEEAIAAIMRYKPDQNHLGRVHDLAAIAKVRELREGKTERSIEKVKALFLTCDSRLCLFNLNEMGHKQNRTISEVVQDRLLTTILWLKNPNSKLSLSAIVAAHSKGLFIDKRVWDRFFEVMRALKADGRVRNAELSNLFYHGYIETELSHISESEANSITAGFVLSQIENAARVREEKSARLVERAARRAEEKKEEELVNEMNKALANMESDHNTDVTEKLLFIRTGIKNAVDHDVRYVSPCGATLFTVMFAIASYYAYKFGDAFDLYSHINLKIGSFDSFLSILIILFGGSGVGVWWKAHAYTRRWYINWSFRRRMKAANLGNMIQETDIPTTVLTSDNRSRSIPIPR